MSETLIRNMVRNILLETRGPLSLYVILKEWVNQLAEHGERKEPRITGPNNTNAQTACLIMPSEHAANDERQRAEAEAGLLIGCP